MNIAKMACFKIKSIFSRRKREKYKKEESHEGAPLVYSHVTYYTAGNAGDTVLSQCVRRMFEKEQNLLGWNLIKVSEAVTSATIAKINNTQALIIGGGGLFLPDTNPNDISGWQWAISHDQLNEINIPIIVYSVGFNYFPGQEPEELFKQSLKDLCEKAGFIGLRNHGSIMAVSSMLPEDLSKKVVYQPCTTTLIRKIYGDQIPSKKHTKKIAFNLAFDREERRYGNYKEEICSSIAKAAKEIEKRGYDVIIVAHCDGDEKIIPFMKQAKVHFEVKNLTRSFPMQVYNFYNEIECVIGMRGHAQMIPFGLNCEIISLGTHDKMRWFLEDINATDWYIDLVKERHNLSEVIVEKFIEIHEKNSTDTYRRLMIEQENLWSISQENMKKISKILSCGEIKLAEE